MARQTQAAQEPQVAPQLGRVGAGHHEVQAPTVACAQSGQAAQHTGQVLLLAHGSGAQGEGTVGQAVAPEHHLVHGPLRWFRGEGRAHAPGDHV